MKELSIEEKAKRYDEAKRRGLDYIRLTPATELVTRQSILEHIFPELKESEDERIRKELIKMVNYFYGSSLNCQHSVSQEDILAWLEKQGGITKLSDEEQNKFAKGVLTSCALSFIDYLDAHKYEDKMCVSNGECEDIENAFHNAMWDRLHRYYCKYIEKQGEQKPAWSEEDEEIYRKCICAMRASACGFPEEEKFVEQVDNWLKSLKDRVQSKREWSEEDKKRMNHIIQFLEDKDRWKDSERAFPIEEDIRWLKSLRPQNTWKPSEGQLECLGYAIEKAEKDWSPLTNNRIYLTLKALKEQLEKL